MYGNHTKVTKTDRVVFPFRQAFETAVASGHSVLGGRVKRMLKRNTGIIFRKRWWNTHKTGQQEVSRDWISWQRNLRIITAK